MCNNCLVKLYALLYRLNSSIVNCHVGILDVILFFKVKKWWNNSNTDAGDLTWLENNGKWIRTNRFICKEEC